jgi:hypothetical protein
MRGEPNILNVAKARDLSKLANDFSSLTVLESADLYSAQVAMWICDRHADGESLRCSISSVMAMRRRKTPTNCGFR